MPISATRFAVMAVHGFAGLRAIAIVIHARGDIRHSAHGLWIYDDDGRRELDLRETLRRRLRGETDLGGGGVLEALLELHGAVVEGKPL